MHSQSSENKIHFYYAVGGEGYVVSGCGHLSTHMGTLELTDLDPLFTNCAGCIRSRHHKKALKQLEQMS